VRHARLENEKLLGQFRADHGTKQELSRNPPHGVRGTPGRIQPVNSSEIQGSLANSGLLGRNHFNNPAQMPFLALLFA